MPFVRDPSHWLTRYSPQEWLRAAQRELKQAEDAYRAKNGRAGQTGAVRAAGIALNGALIVVPQEAWGRTYVEHLRALERDVAVPPRVREACSILLQKPAGANVVALRSPKEDERVLEAARDLVAHAFAVIKRNEPLRDAGAAL